MKILMASNAIVALGLVINDIFGFSILIRDYAVLFFLMFFMQTVSGVVTCYVRGIDQIADLSVSSVLVSIFTIGCNIIFLVVFNWGLNGYFWANIIGPLAQIVYLIVRAGMFHDTDLKSDFAAEKKEMLDYSKPMIANSVAWWINNTSDRYFFLWLS